jgi:hypothetical protein
MRLPTRDGFAVTLGAGESREWRRFRMKAWHAFNEHTNPLAPRSLSAQCGSTNFFAGSLRAGSTGSRAAVATIHFLNAMTASSSARPVFTTKV